MPSHRLPDTSVLLANLTFQSRHEEEFFTIFLFYAYPGKEGMYITEGNRRQRETRCSGCAYMDLLEYCCAHPGPSRDRIWVPDGEHLCSPLPSNCSPRLRHNPNVTFQMKIMIASLLTFSLPALKLENLILGCLYI